MNASTHNESETLTPNESQERGLQAYVVGSGTVLGFVALGLVGLILFAVYSAIERCLLDRVFILSWAAQCKARKATASCCLSNDQDESEADTLLSMKSRRQAGRSRAFCRQRLLVGALA